MISAMFHTRQIMSNLYAVFKLLISKALVDSDLILMKTNFRVLSSLEQQFPVMGCSVALMVVNLLTGTRYLSV